MNDENNAELRANGNRVSEQATYFSGRGAGCNVKIFGINAQQLVSHAPASKIRGEAALAQ